MAEQLLRLENLSKYYTSAQSVVMGLNSLNLTFCRGEFVAITGESGSGKSTLAHVLGGILPYESGELYFRGKPTSHFDGTDYERYRRDQISFISQNYGILPGCTVLENVVSALRLSGLEKGIARQRAEAILRQVELWELRKRRAAKLSSGQKQRLSIARALAKPASILIADEPTGNLDPENSAKVMELLAHAAKERLVILITHEFSEAENLATRHIALQDGQVALDVSLRPAAEAVIQEAVKAKKQPLSGYVTRLQLAGRPVWMALVLAFFTLTAFAVFAFLGTFMIALDDTSTRIYDTSAFRNGDRERIVAVVGGGEPLTQEDYEAFLSCEYVMSVEKYGYAADINYGYREGVDFKYVNTITDHGTWDDPDLELTTAAYLTAAAPFIKTIPMMAGEREFLTAGRLPENHREVVLAGSADQIGTVLLVYIQDVKNWSQSALIAFTATVVGVTDYGEGLYFHENIGRMFVHDMAFDLENRIFLPAEDLADDEIRPSAYIYNQVLTTTHPPRIVTPRCDMDMQTADWDIPDSYVFLNLVVNDSHMSEDHPQWRVPWHTSQLNKFCEVSPATFEKVTWQENADQVSITIEDYAYTDRVVEQLKEKGYTAISPFREGSTKIDEALAAERKQTLAVCLAVLLAVLLLQVTVLRALFGTQTENYRLLGNIGLTCPTAKRSILWQVLLFTALGQLLGLGILLLCGHLGVERIVYVLRYLPWGYMIVLSAVHLMGALTAAAWVVRAVTKQVFPMSGKQSDLPLEEEEAAV